MIRRQITIYVDKSTVSIIFTCERAVTLTNYLIAYFFGEK